MPTGTIRAAWPCIPRSRGISTSPTSRPRLNKLPDDQREALVLVGASGFSYEEAAHICNVAVGTIKSRVSRARTQLAQQLNITNETDIGPDQTAAAIYSSLGQRRA